MARFVFSRISGSFKENSNQIQSAIAVAATLAVREAGSNALRLGRASTAASLGNRFSNALHVRFYPQGNKASINAAALVYSKIFYAGIFEESEIKIHGNPRLWLPTDNIPNRLGGHRVTPDIYMRQFGGLTKVNVPGHPPMLMGRVPKTLFSGLLPGQTLKLGKPTRKKGKRFASARVVFVNVPMFVGLDSVTMNKKTDVVAIAARERSKLGEYYLKHINEG